MTYIRIIEGQATKFHLKSLKTPFLVLFLAIAGVFIACPAIKIGVNAWLIEGLNALKQLAKPPAQALKSIKTACWSPFQLRTG